LLTPFVFTLANEAFRLRADDFLLLNRRFRI
jgi:hypothetical protein